MIVIKDGTGSGNQLKVNYKNHLEADVVAQTRIADISVRTGQAYTIASGFISLTTTASYSGVLWIKNTDTEGRDMFIEHIRVCGTGAGTMSMEAVQCVVYRNPTTGTLISGASSAYKTNNNFGSANEFNGIAYKGADANTITNGDWFTQFTTHIPGHSIIDFNDSIVLPKNSSIGFALKPTVACEICMEVNVHFE
jgi:hypothetical protein